MSIGQILLQPQKLRRARTRASDGAILDDLLALAMLVIVDGAQDGPLPNSLALAFEDALTQMAQQSAAGATNAATYFATPLQPLISGLQSAVQAASDQPAAVLEMAMQALSGVLNGLKTLSAGQLRQKLQAVFNVVEHDLGFTPDFIGQWIWDLFDRMVAALQPPVAAETPDQRARRREAAAILQRIKRYGQANFTFPRLDADRAAQALLDLLRRPEVDAALAKVGCVSQASAAFFNLGSNVVDLLGSQPAQHAALPPFHIGFGPGFAAPAAPVDPLPPLKIGYYATKLLSTQNWDGDWGELAASVEPNLSDGYMSQELRDAFRPLSIVLADFAFMLTVEEHKEWKVVDRKKYMIQKQNNTLIVFRLLEMSLSDFEQAISGDQSGLRKFFKENGMPLTDPVTVTHVEGGNSWDLEVGGTPWRAFLFSGTVTIQPTDRTGILFEIAAALESDLVQGRLTDELVAAFGDKKVPLSPRARISKRDDPGMWNLDDGEFEFKVSKEKGKLQVSTGGFFGTVFAALGWPQGERLWINRQRTQVMLGQRIVHTGTNITWQDAPIFNQLAGNSYYSFARLQPETIEKWAYHTSWIQDTLNAVMYIATIAIKAEQGQAAYSTTSNSLKAARSIADMLAKLIKERSISDLIGIDSQTWLFDWGWWYDMLVDLGIKAAGAAEGIAKPSTPDTTGASKFSQFVDTVLSVFVGVDAVDTYWVGLAYEGVLSFLTLLNHKEPTTPGVERPENYKENGGFVDPWWNVALLIYCAAIPDDKYALPFQTLDLTLYYWFLGVLGLSTVTGFLAWLTGQLAVAGSSFGADYKHLAKTLLKTWGKSAAYFWPFLKLVKGKNT